MAWPKAIEWHFWLSVTGTLVYVVALWNAGITQGLMWRTYDASGALAYSFLGSVVAMAPTICSARSAGRCSSSASSSAR